MYIFNHGRDINKIKDVLTQNSQQSAHKTQDKSRLDITYRNHNIKQWHIVEYLGCPLDSNLHGESCNKNFEKS